MSLDAAKIPPSPILIASEPVTQAAVQTESQPAVQAESPPSLAPKETVAVTPLAGQNQAPLVDLSSAPTEAEARQNFKQDFGLEGKSYLKSNDPKLSQTLKSFAGKLTEDMKKSIGRNPRGLDFMHSLNKAAQGKALTRDDIESIQLFLAKDTRYGSEIGYAKDPNGMDGKYGFRTHSALERLLNNFQPSDLVHDEYYARLDRDGIPYAKYK